MNPCYQANTASVAHETFDGETVLINFERGTYFSLRHSAPVIWGLIQQPIGIDGILRRLADAYPSLPADAGDAVSAMLEQLHDEGCVTRHETGAEESAPGAPPVVGEFALPVVQAFHDLQELIAIDPVHEVANFDGWPHRPPSFALD
jgi:hypothetical protein